MKVERLAGSEIEYGVRSSNSFHRVTHKLDHLSGLWRQSQFFRSELAIDEVCEVYVCDVVDEHVGLRHGIGDTSSVLVQWLV